GKGGLIFFEKNLQKFAPLPFKRREMVLRPGVREEPPAGKSSCLTAGNTRNSLSPYAQAGPQVWSEARHA
ncbi:MAG: hypothetical protein ACOVLK_00245, partial [Terrimicrobiaceae bacterium]